MKKLGMIAMIMALLAVSTQASNLVVNGTMEPVGSSGEDLWTPQGPWVMVPGVSSHDAFKPGPAYAAYDHTTPGVADASGSMFIYGNGIYSPSYFQQDITVEPGMWYKIVFWTRYDGSEGLTHVDRAVNVWHTGISGQQAFLNDNPGVQFNCFTANGTWTRVYREFLANIIGGLETNTVTLKFSWEPGIGGSGYSTVVVDDVFVCPIIPRIANGGFADGYSNWTHGGGVSLQATSIVDPYSILMSNAGTEATAGETFLKQQATWTDGTTQVVHEQLDPGTYEIKLTSRGVSTGGTSKWALYLYDNGSGLNGQNALRSYEIAPVDDVNTLHTFHYYCAESKSVTLSVEPKSGSQGQIYLDGFSMMEMEYTGPYVCGDPGTNYSKYDLNADCYVNFEDLALFAGAWLKCSDPANANCGN